MSHVKCRSGSSVKFVFKIFFALLNVCSSCTFQNSVLSEYNNCWLLQGKANLGAATSMRLSLVFELLLIFILLAFAASRVIGKWITYCEMMFIKIERKLFSTSHSVTDSSSLDERKVPRQGPPNRYCACTNLMCNCCREFSLAVVPIKGPGELFYAHMDVDITEKQAIKSLLKRCRWLVTKIARKYRPTVFSLKEWYSEFLSQTQNLKSPYPCEQNRIII